MEKEQTLWDWFSDGLGSSVLCGEKPGRVAPTSFERQAYADAAGCQHQMLSASQRGRRRGSPGGAGGLPGLCQASRAGALAVQEVRGPGSLASPTPL